LIIVVGIDGADDAIKSIEAGGIKTTVILPVGRIAEMSVIQADMYLKTDSTGQPEKNQSIVNY
jgi:erythritol transport system substrate-binding protein